MSAGSTFGRAVACGRRDPWGRPERPACLRLSAAAAAIAVFALAASSCGTVNYLDPEGPRYYGTARPAPAEDPSADEGGRPLRLVTFNIEYGREIDRAVSLLRENEALRNPDVLLLQEMDSRGVERIAAELGLNYLYYPSGIHSQAKKEFGTAILSPWPIEEPAKILLPHGAALTEFRRAVTAATIRWGRVSVRVFSVHLPGPLSISLDERRDQVERIVEAAATWPGAAIVAGDFNGRSVGTWFESAGYDWVTGDLKGTSRGPGFWLSFDHVFTRGLRPALAGPSVGRVDAPGISDHRAVWAKLELQARLH